MLNKIGPMYVPGFRVDPEDDGRMAVRFDFEPEAVRRIKSVPGHRWHPKEKAWSVPATAVTVFTARNYKGPLW